MHDSNLENQPVVGSASEARVRPSVPDRIDLHVSVGDLPKALADAVENLGKRESAPSVWKAVLKAILKDYLPALTPIATAIIAGMVSFYIYSSDHDRSKEALDKTLSEFGQNTDDRARAIAAIKLATYGDKALEAVRMVLGSDDPYLRSGGVLVAEQMYRAETVRHRKLIKKMLSYYAANDRFLRRGVLEWLIEMEHQLSEEEGRLAYQVVAESFGPRGELCTTQDEEVAREAANFLFIWSFGDSKTLVLGMAEECRDVKQPAKFAAARESAVNTIPKLAESLTKEERSVLLKDDLPRLRKAAPELDELIDKAIASIQRMQEQ
jgi:hypothetical protein